MLTKGKKSKLHDVTPIGRGIFRVVSVSGESYDVRFQNGIEGAVCSCAYGSYRPYADHYRSGCSHVIAAYTHYYKLAGQAVSAWSSLEDAKRQRRPIVYIGDNTYLTLRRLR